MVTARVQPGAVRVRLLLQAVEPGSYIRKSDPEYAKNWTELPMLDDGRDGDTMAGDGVYAARVPGSGSVGRNSVDGLDATSRASVSAWS